MLISQLHHPVLVIGIGNRFRSDDAAGLIVVRKLRGLVPAGVEILEMDGDGARLLDIWQGREWVFLIDAIQCPKSEKQIYRWDICDMSLPKEFFHYSTHAFSLADAIELGRALDQMPARGRVYGIRGERFFQGEGLSPSVATKIDEAVQKILAEINEVLGVPLQKKESHA
jgi:hydrogenase maturation protease